MTRLILTFLLCACSLAMWGQKKQLDKANKHYNNGEFGAAMKLYETVEINPNSVGVRSKLAYCYLMNNRIEDAEKIYAAVVQHKRARPETFFLYGKCLMGNEKYDEAKVWFEKYAELKPKDERTIIMLRACDEVRHIEPHFKNFKIAIFPKNSEADDNSGVFWNGGVVFTSDRPTNGNLLKEKSGATGRDFLNIYYSKQPTEDIQFTKPERLSAKLSELNKNTANATFSGDSSMIVFSRNSNVLNRSSSYNLQLYSAKAKNNSFKKIKKLKFCSGEINYMHPALSPSGNLLFFTSDKPGGEGGTDLYVSQRNGDKWSIPKNMGELVNSPGNEGFPFMDDEGNLYFCSKGHVGYGGYDIFMTKRDKLGRWQKPKNLGRPINSSYDDVSISIEKGGKRGIFTSSRLGGDDDLFLIYFADEAGVFPEFLGAN